MATLASILGVTADPDVAYLLLIAGLLAVSIEILHPGGYVGGVIGALALIAAGVFLAELPVNGLGLALILAGVGLLIVEAYLPGGIVGALGLSGIIMGGVVLFDRSSDVRVSGGVLIGVGIAVAAFGLLVVRALARLRRDGRPPINAVDLVGTEAIVERAGDPGVVRAQSGSWTARGIAGLPEGARVRIVRVDGLTLEVVPDPGGSDR